MKHYEILIEAHSPLMKKVLKEVVSILESQNVNYVIGGANALAVYSNRPRTTIDIDFFVDISKKQELENKLINKKFEIVYIDTYQSKFKKHAVEVDLLYAGNNAEYNAINTHIKEKVLGIVVNTPTPEGLLWLYIMSSNEQNTVDAINLIRSTNDIDLEYIKKHLDNSELDKLSYIIKKASENNNRKIINT